MASEKEWIDELIDRNMLVVIRFRDVEGEEVTTQGHLISRSEVSGREMIETDAGLIIGVDQLISLNDRNL